MNAQELENAIYAEWSNMHHNASIAACYPELQNDYEYQLFWDCLGDYVRGECAYLSEIIEDDFGEKLTFYSYGRMGATIAPSEYMGPCGGSGFGAFNGETLAEYHGLSGIDAYNRNRKILKMLSYINGFWRCNAKHVSEWWRDMKEANDLQEDIDAHDGKTARMVQVWA